MITDASGNIPQKYFYYPYGGMVASIGSDPNHYKFTGKERDSESGDDYFGARYYASTTGRFMSPDWAVRPITVPYAVFGDPQTLNLYTYVENSPLNRVDADGHGEDTGHSNTNETPSEGQCPHGDTRTMCTQQQKQQTVIKDQNQQSAEQQAEQQKAPLTSVTVLGHDVKIRYDNKLSDADKLAASDAIAAAASLLNKNADKLTADEKGAIGHISSFSVLAPDSQIGAVGKGSMGLTAQYIHDASAAWLGSLFGHEGQHYLNAGKYKGANLWKDEQSAGKTQLGIGNKTGFTDSERRVLQE